MRILLVIFLLLSPALGKAQPTLLPVDEAPLNPDFLSFREHLFRIIERRDASAMKAVLVPGFKFSFGEEEESAEAFIEDSDFDNPASSFWPNLEKVLKLGGRLEGEDGFSAPYVFTDWPQDQNSFESMAVTGTNVRVRQAPGLHSVELARLSYSIVLVASTPENPEDWHKVTLEDGRQGYVSGRYLRSPLDYRAGFRKIEGRWYMIYFIAGD
jgi:hypothetical protein